WKLVLAPVSDHGWIERALEHSDPDTVPRARALIARAWYDPTVFADTAREASDLAERLSDLELRSWALAARSRSSYATGAYGDAADWSRRRLDLLPEIVDTDRVAMIYFYTLDPPIAMGRFDEARPLAAAHVQV